MNEPVPAMHQHDDRPLLGFVEIGAILWRGRALLVGALILGAVVGIIVARLKPPVYLAEAMLIVRPAVSSTIEAETPAAWLGATTRDVMATRELVEETLRSLQMSKSRPTGSAPNEAISQEAASATSIGADEIEAVQRNLTLSSNAGSFAITVQQRSRSPSFGAEFANALVQAYIDRRIRDLERVRSDRRAALTTRYNQAQAAAKEAANAVAALARQLNAQGSLELGRQRVAELRQIEQALSLQIERLDATTVEPNIHFISPAVVPATRVFTSQLLIAVGLTFALPGAVAAILLLRNQLMPGTALRRSRTRFLFSRRRTGDRHAS